MSFDLSKANPNFKLYDKPLRINFRGKTLDASEWTTAWLEPAEGERMLQIQGLFIKDPSKAARTIEIDISEKDVARLYGILTEFLTETLKRTKKAEGE